MKPFAGWPLSYCTKILQVFLDKLLFIGTDQIQEGNGLCLFIQIQEYELF